MSFRFSLHPEFKIENKKIESKEHLLSIVEKRYLNHYSFLKKWFDDTDEITVQTSGSTGEPKNIVFKKDSLIKSAFNTIHFFDLPPETKALLSLSSNFIAGKLMWIRAFVGGWNLYISEPSHKSVNKILQIQSFDFGAFVPLQVYQNFLLIGKIKKLLIGGGSLSLNLQKQLTEQSNFIFSTYGMTETLTHIAVKPLTNPAVDFINFPVSLLDYYHVMEGIEISTDKRGCLLVKAPYIDKNPIITNDLVEINDQHYFKWLGRYDNMIKSGGIKLFPEQIEKKLSPYINKNFFVASMPDEKLGEKLILIIESEEQQIDLPDFLNFLDVYEFPKNIFYISSFLLTKSGKIKRKETLKKVLNHL